MAIYDGPNEPDHFKVSRRNETTALNGVGKGRKGQEDFI